MPERHPSQHVAVIGAGIVGAAAAIELLRDGHRVTIVEPETPGGVQAASYGNGAWLSPASVVPMSMPGLWRKVPGLLLDPLGPLTIRWTSLWHLLPWLCRFILAGATVPRVERTARALNALLADAPARHQDLAEEMDCGDLIERRGLLYVYPDRAAFQAEALAWRLRRDNGIGWLELDAAALHRREPSLHARYTLGILVEAGGHCRDPGRYVGALVAHALRLGATRLKAAVTGFGIGEGRLGAVITDAGVITCDRAVIAAGVRSAALARAAGDRVSLASERGYHVVIGDPEAGPLRPLMPSDGKMANTPTLAGLRVSGQVELAGTDAAPNWARSDILLAHARSTYPGLAVGDAAGRITRWMGHRPSTPDGLPVIGPATATADIVYAFGHGHVGLAAGPITGRLVADIIAGRTPTVPLDAYAANRFRSVFGPRTG